VAAPALMITVGAAVAAARKRHDRR